MQMPISDLVRRSLRVSFRMIRLGNRRLLPAGHNAAVNGENDAGNETRLIGGEKQQRFRCIRRLAIAVAVETIPVKLYLSIDRSDRE